MVMFAATSGIQKVKSLAENPPVKSGGHVPLLTYLLSQSSLSSSEALSHALDLMTGGVETVCVDRCFIFIIK